MNGPKDVRLRTKPPVGVQYITWCNDCEEAVTNDDATCVECESLDLEYFIRESDHLAATQKLNEQYSAKLAEKDAEIAQLQSQLADALDNGDGTERET